MNIVLRGGAAFLIAAAALSGSAEAQCLWTGYGWSCTRYGYASPYASGGPNDRAFGYYRGRNSAYGAYGAASHMGPDPGGGFYHMGNSNIGHTD